MVALSQMALLIMYEICWSSNDRLLIMDEICWSSNDRLLIMDEICWSSNDRPLIMDEICWSCNDTAVDHGWNLFIMLWYAIDHGDDMLIVPMIGVLIMHDVLQNYVTMKVIVITTFDLRLWFIWPDTNFGTRGDWKESNEKLKKLVHRCISYIIRCTMKYV